MRPLSDIRRDRLRLLVEEAGGQSALAIKINKDRRQVSAWLTDPAKPGAKGISDESARGIEAKCMKPPGWMDHDSDEALPSQRARTDPDRMADALKFLEYLGDLQGVPELVRDPVALCIAYDFLEHVDATEGNVIDITRQLAAKLKDQPEDEPKK